MHQWQGEVWVARSAVGEGEELRNVRSADGDLIGGATWDALRPGDEISLALLDQAAMPTGVVVSGAFEVLRRRFAEWHLAGWHDGLTD